MSKDLFSIMLGSSVSQSVSHAPLTDKLTNPRWSGGDPTPIGVYLTHQDNGALAFTDTTRAIVGEALAQIVNVPLHQVRPVAEFGRVVIVSVTPVLLRDPVLPLAIGETPPGYYHHYAAYWNALLRWIGGDVFTTRRKITRLARRVSIAIRPHLNPAEAAWFNLWIAHGVLGEAQWKELLHETPQNATP